MSTNMDSKATAEAGRGIPLMLASQALQSLRESGYSLAAAIGEVIDNSVEADANNILVQLDEGTNERGKKHVHRIAFVDDGSGMDVEVLQHYPQLGYSTRYMRTDTIGKFGVGAKLAALNFGRRIDVWSRTSADDPWMHVYFDLDEAIEVEKDGEEALIESPTADPVPGDMTDLMPKGTGTVVLWTKVDRLESGRRAADFDSLRLDVEKELSRIFRVFIDDGIKILVNGRVLLPHDPLMLMGGTWAEQVLTDYYTNGDGLDKPWKPDPLHFDAELILEEEIKVAGHTALVTVTLYPRSVLRSRGMGGDNLAKSLRVPENQGAISFMRHDREISYTNVPRILPGGVTDPDRFIGIEVSFAPELDDYFGVRNVKRGAEPHDQLREKIRVLLGRAIPEARRKIEESWGKAAQQAREHSGEHAPIEDAVAEANRTMPKGRAKSDRDPEDAIAELAKDVLGAEAPELEREAYVERAKERPFVVESVDFPGTQFIDVQHVGGQVIIRINTRHRFYRESWEPLKQIASSDPGTLYSPEVVKTAQRTIETLTLLLVAYGKAESMNEHPQEQYGELLNYWGMFLDTLMGKVKEVL